MAEPDDAGGITPRKKRGIGSYIIPAAIAILVIAGIVMFTSGRGGNPDTNAGPTPTTIPTILQLQSSIATLTTNQEGHSARLASIEKQLAGLAAPDVTQADIDNLQTSIANLQMSINDWSENFTLRISALENTTEANATLRVITEGVDITGNTSATLCGSFNTTGNDTCLTWFEYGNTIAYGKTTLGVGGIVAGVARIFCTPIALLNPDTTYHFRACASNSVGTVYGNDMSFNTTPSLPIPTPNTTTWLPSVSIVAVDTANLTATLPAGNIGENAGSYLIEISVSKTANWTGDNATLVLSLVPGNPVAVSSSTTFGGTAPLYERQTEPLEWACKPYGSASSCSLIVGTSDITKIPVGTTPIKVWFNLVYGS